MPSGREPLLPTVLIADDEVVYAEAVTRFLARHYVALPPIHTCNFLRGILGLVQVDVVLLDLAFGRESALDIIEDLVRENSATRFVVLTGLLDSYLPSLVLRLGAHGFVQKPATLDEIRGAVDEALKGGRPQLLEDRPGSPSPPRRKDGDWASTREKVAWLLDAGVSQKTVRTLLHVSDKDMQYQVRRIKLERASVPRTRGVDERDVPC